MLPRGCVTAKFPSYDPSTFCLEDGIRTWREYRPQELTTAVQALSDAMPPLPLVALVTQTTTPANEVPTLFSRSN